MTFEYFFVAKCNGELEIDDISNCAIVARNDIGNEYYLLIKTIYGETTILEYGPAQPDFMNIPDYVNINYRKFSFDQNKISSIIEKFINNPRNIITQVTLESTNYILDNIKNLTEPFSS